MPEDEYRLLVLMWLSFLTGFKLFEVTMAARRYVKRPSHSRTRG